MRERVGFNFRCYENAEVVRVVRGLCLLCFGFYRCRGDDDARLMSVLLLSSEEYADKLHPSSV